MKNIIFLGITCMALAACAAPGVSPKDANLFEAAGNLHSGEFDKQLQRKQLELEGSKVEQASEQQKQATLQTDLAAKQQELAALEAELVSLKQQNLTLEKKISQQQAKTRQQKAKRKELLGKIAATKKKIAATETAKPDAGSDTGEYQQRVKELRQEIQVLQGMAID